MPRQQGHASYNIKNHVEAVNPEKRPEHVFTHTPNKRVAIIVCHGMGIQIPYETVQRVVAALKQKVDPNTFPAEAGNVSTQRVLLTGSKDALSYADTTVSYINGKNTEDIEVHTYEIYWSPLTKGQANLREIINFLYQTATGGMLYAFFSRKRRSSPEVEAKGFTRWLMGEFQKNIPVNYITTIFSLLTGLVVLLSLVSINSLLVILTVLHNFPFKLPGNWPDPALISQLTVNMIGYQFLCGMIAIFPFGIIPLITWASSKRESLKPLIKFLEKMVTPLIVFALLMIPLCAWNLKINVDEAAMHSGDQKPAEIRVIFYEPIDDVSTWLLQHCSKPFQWLYQHAPAGSSKWLKKNLYLATEHELQRGMPLWMYWLGWGLPLWISNKLRFWLLQYAGDVMIYVSAYRVNRFHEVRMKVRETALNVVRSVYSAQAYVDAANKINTKDAYDRVVVVGHSLGSVVAYDALNALVNEDYLNGETLNVPDRTFNFITIGSPLDKTAYLFRTQAAPSDAVREALAATEQPLRVSYAFRPKHWVNIWSPLDWISGPLDFYDYPNCEMSNRQGDRVFKGPKEISGAKTFCTLLKVPPDKEPTEFNDPSKAVINCQDLDAHKPLSCHSDYWDHPIFQSVLYISVIGNDKDLK